MENGLSLEEIQRLVGMQALRIFMLERQIMMLLAAVKKDAEEAAAQK